MELDQPAWLAIGFIVFIYFAYRPIRNAILTSLDAKIARISQDVEEARSLPKEAEDTLSQVKEEIARANKQLEVDLAESRAEIKQIMDEKTVELNNVLKHKEIDSKQRISHITESAIKNIHSEQIENARAIVEGYLKEQQQIPSDMEIANKFLSIDKK